MKFLADLHVHSRYSRATSKDLSIHSLAIGAKKKGIDVLGTGDFTHPLWIQELEENLEDAEPGLYRLKQRDLDVRFVLTSEISTIYKQGGSVRKVHHLIVAPNMEVAHKIGSSLARIGNIASDGRPILGISSRDLLEVVLTADSNAFLIPAHIWTPWFSALGSKSGFDSIKECYGDLEPYIFAVETGLSSDPPMNWRVSSLDRYHLVSNSDAHSAAKIGREATIFSCEMNYFSMMDAMKTGNHLEGTVEFFPEEGKYHLDGHRACGVVLSPEETKELGGICPVCSRPLTVGVLNRVISLSDRDSSQKPESARPFYSLIPLAEILGEIMGVGPSSKRVLSQQEKLLTYFQGELKLLLDADLEEIRSVAGEILGFAIERMRTGKVHKEAGYDGKFGKITIFHKSEMRSLFGGHSTPRMRENSLANEKGLFSGDKRKVKASVSFTATQSEVVNFQKGVLIVRAGPGTGKTRVLTERMLYLLNNGARPDSMLALTFTTKACDEIKQRVGRDDLDVYTFHSLAARLLKDAGRVFSIADDSILAVEFPGKKDMIETAMASLSRAEDIDAEVQTVIDELRHKGLYPFEMLISEAIDALSSQEIEPSWEHVMVDEFQDTSPLQYSFLKLITRRAESTLVIGDPHQSIYAFRGSDPRVFERLHDDFRETKEVKLRHSHRLNRTIARASNSLIGEDAVEGLKDGMPIQVVKTPWPATFVAREIELVSGGLSHNSAGEAKADYALSQVAVIVRTRVQARTIIKALSDASIPHEVAYERPFSEMSGIRERLAILENSNWPPYVKGVGEKSLIRLRAGQNLDGDLGLRIGKAKELVNSITGSILHRIRTVEESRLFNLPTLPGDHEFYKYARVFGDDLDGFIQWCRLKRDHEGIGGEKVRVLTAHAVKGMEFRCVFMVGLEKGLFPLASEPLREEENLFYVAMTRAIDRLYLVYSHEPSCFIDRIPKDLKAFRSMGGGKKAPRQMVLFD